MTTAAVSAWRWQPHPEVWLLLAGAVALGIYAVRVVGPKVVSPGEPVITRRQIGFWTTGLVLLYVASDWPLHDIAEEQLYSAHMLQHLLITFVVPPLLLLGTPTWLARLVVGDQVVGRWVRRLAHPVVAGVLFNGLIALTHWPALVNASVENGALHYSVHLAVFTTALLMWTPVCGPLPELRLSLPGQMVYLFTMSIIPTIPAAWLTFAEGAVYSAYDHPDRLWGIGVAADQQAAGVLMKIGAGFFLWTLITVLFFRWAYRHMEADRLGSTPTERELLTWDDVEKEFERLGPAPSEDPAH